jgi:hypothetical protein
VLLMTPRPASLHSRVTLGAASLLILLVAVVAGCAPGGTTDATPTAAAAVSPGGPSATAPRAAPSPTPVASTASTEVPRPSGALAWPTAFDVELGQGTYFSSPPFAVPFTLEVTEPGWFSGHLHGDFFDLLRFDGVPHTGVPTLMLAFGDPGHWFGPAGEVPDDSLSPAEAADMTAEVEFLTASNRAPVELLGLSGIRIDVRAAAPNTHVFGGPGGDFGAGPQQPFRMAILERDGGLFLVLVLADEGAQQDDLDAAWDRTQAILESIDFMG